MRKILKIAGIVAVANLLCFWISYGLVAVVGVWAFEHYGFADGRAPAVLSFGFDLLVRAIGILGTPGVTIPFDRMHVELTPFHLVSCSILNAVIWGLGFGFVVYPIVKKFRRFVAKHRAPANGVA